MKRALAIILMVIVVLAAGLLALPHLLNLEPVKDKITRELSQSLKAQVKVTNLYLHFLPRPQVRLTGLEISSPSRFKASVKSMTVRPNLWALLQKKVIFEGITVDNPEVDVFLKAAAKKKEPLWPKLAKALALSVYLEVENGQVRLWQEEKKLLRIDLPSGALRVEQGQALLEVEMISSLFKQAQLSLLINQEGHLEAKGTVAVFKLHQIPFDIPWLPIKPVKAEVNLQATLNLDSPHSWEVGFSGSVPCYRLPQADYDIRCGHFEGWATRKGERYRIKLNTLKLDYPQIIGEGELWYQPKKIGYRFLGQEVDIVNTRKVALDLLGRYQSVRKLFAIVLEGQAKGLEVSGEAPTIAGLKDLRRLSLKTGFTAARVILPGSGLEIQQAQGELQIRQGILQARGLSAKIGLSQILEAKVEIALKDPKGPLNLDLLGICRLEEVPDIIHRFIKKGALRHHIDLFYQATGSARVSLRLRGTRKKITPVLEVLNIKGTLHHRRIPYSIVIQSGAFGYQEGSLWWKNLNGFLGESQISRATGSLVLSSLWIKAQARGEKILLTQVDSWVQREPVFRPLSRIIRFLEGKASLEASLRGPLKRPRKLEFNLQGEVSGGRLQTPYLPGELKIKRASFQLDNDHLRLNQAQGRFLESDLLLDVELIGLLKGIKGLRLKGEGTLNTPLVRWLWEKNSLPEDLFPRTPLKIKGLSFSSDLKQRVDLALLAQRGGGTLALAWHSDLEDLELKKLEGSLGQSNVRLSLQLKRDHPWIKFSFTGRLRGEFIKTFLAGNRFLEGTLWGESSGLINLENPLESRIDGELHVERLRRILGLRIPLGINHLALEARGQEIEIKELDLTAGQSRLQVLGQVAIRQGEFWFDLEASSPRFDWPAIQKEFFKKKGAKGYPLAGIIRFSTPVFIYQPGRVFKSVVADLRLSLDKKILIDLKEARYCGIDLSGKIKIVPGQEAGLDINLSAQKGDLENLALCLFGERHLLQGSFDLQGKVKARGQKNPLLEESQGDFIFRSSGGRIYRLNLLSKIFTILNPLEIFQGGLPDLVKEGFAYEGIEARARLKDGLLKLDYLAIDGRPMKIFAEGTINLLSSQADLEVLVAPLKTIDSIISKIPLVGFILTGEKKVLISIPIKVKGPIRDPAVWPLPPSSIGSGILGVVKRALNVPALILKPLEGGAPKEPSSTPSSQAP